MSEEKVTWDKVCENVQFADGLYRTCRDKVEGFTGLEGGGEEELYDPESFGDELADSALAVPPPPPDDWQPEGFLDDLMDRGLGQWLLLAGAGAALWWLFRPSTQQTAVSEAAPVQNAPPASTTSQAA